MNQVAASLRHVVRRLRQTRARCIDRYLRIDTITPVDIGERCSLHGDSVHYEPPDYPRLAHTLWAARIEPDDVVYEIGCGMGRIVCVLARRRIDRVIGIEISSALADRAQRNLMTLRGRRSRAEIIIADAANADYTGGTVYVLYNPFGERTMRAVMRRIESSWVADPRLVRIVYMHPVHHEVLDALRWIRKTAQFRLPGYKSGSAIWESVDCPGPKDAARPMG